MGFRLKKTVVLVGMMGSGKTAVGTALAKLLGVPFADSDARIEAEVGMTVADIFARAGEPFFRDQETLMLTRLLKDECCILSTGGGAFMSAVNRCLIGQRGAAVWLKADAALLWSRVRHKSTRPILHTADPFATLSALAAERGPIYAQAGLVVEARAGYAVKDMAAKVCRALLGRPDILTRKQ